jgi:excisionase family DNA binding protein
VIKVIDSDVVPEVDPYVESDPGPRPEPEHDVEADLGSAPGRVDENDDGDFTDGDMSGEDSDLGTPREVATYLGPDGPSERTIQRLVSDGEIPTHEVGGRTLVSAENVRAHWERQRTTTPLSKRMTAATSPDTTVAAVTSSVVGRVSSEARAGPRAATEAILLDADVQRAEAVRAAAQLDAARAKREAARMQRLADEEDECDALRIAKMRAEAELAVGERRLVLEERRQRLQWAEEDRRRQREIEERAERTRQQRLDQRVEAARMARVCDLQDRAEALVRRVLDTAAEILAGAERAGVCHRAESTALLVDVERVFEGLRVSGDASDLELDELEQRIDACTGDLTYMVRTLLLALLKTHGGQKARLR